MPLQIWFRSAGWRADPAQGWAYCFIYTPDFFFLLLPGWFCSIDPSLLVLPKACSCKAKHLGCLTCQSSQTTPIKLRDLWAHCSTYRHLVVYTHTCSLTTCHYYLFILVLCTVRKRGKTQNMDRDEAGEMLLYLPAETPLLCACLCFLSEGQDAGKHLGYGLLVRGHNSGPT